MSIRLKVIIQIIPHYLPQIRLLTFVKLYLQPQTKSSTRGKYTATDEFHEKIAAFRMESGKIVFVGN